MVRKMRSQLFENPCKSQQRKLCIYPNHEKKRRASSKEPGGDTQNSQEPTEETSGPTAMGRRYSRPKRLRGLFQILLNLPARPAKTSKDHPAGQKGRHPLRHPG